MNTRSAPGIPWGRVLLVLAGALAGAWLVGYLAGLIVRFLAARN
jgi:hypothetical protein